MKKLQKEKERIIALFKRNRCEEALERLRTLRENHSGDYELYYLEGMIISTQFLFADAIRCFERSLQINPRHVESEFELGVIHLRLCRFNKAAVFLNAALAKNYRPGEVKTYLGQIEKIALRSDVTLSACLIVKNEEERLATCLKSLEAVADEIVIVDTGSEDGTIAIAESFGAKVLHFQWCRDFAAARNFANQHATGDWIIQLDADEELFPQDQNKVRELIHQNECDGAYVALHNRVSNSFGENSPSIHYLVRLYKNRPDFYFRGTIHETLKIPGEVPPVDINILHHGYNLDAGYMDQKRRRNAEILYRRYQQEPENPTNLFYLSMMHLGNREFDLAESYALQAIERIDFKNVGKQHLYLMMLNNLALINNEKGNHQNVKKYCKKAIALNANYLDPYFFLGMTYFSAGDLQRARKIFLEYIQRIKDQSKQPIFNLFGSSADTYLYQVYHFLGKIYRKEQNQRQAKKWLTKAVELNANFWVALVDLAYIAVDEKDWQNAADFFDRAIKYARNNPEVNKKNELLWVDFTNAVKSYMKVLQKIRQMTQQKASNVSVT